MEQFIRQIFFDLGGDGLVDFSASTSEAKGKLLDGEWVPWPFVDDAFGGIVRPIYVSWGGMLCVVLVGVSRRRRCGRSSRDMLFRGATLEWGRS